MITDGCGLFVTFQPASDFRFMSKFFGAPHLAKCCANGEFRLSLQRIMKKKKVKRLRITEKDFLLANRKAAREEEILAHGKPISFRSHLHKSKKQYDRKRLKRALKSLDEGSAR